jgi:hypothetical protein
MDPKDKKPPKEQDPVQQLRDRLAALVSEQEQILNSATAAKRDLTDDENAKLEKIEADQKKLENDVARRIAAAEAQERLDRQLPSLISGDVAHEKADARAAGRNPDRRPPITGRDIEATSRTHGFASAQDWFKAIRASSIADSTRPRPRPPPSPTRRRDPRADGPSPPSTPRRSSKP